MEFSNSSHQRTGRSALPWLSVLLAVVLFAVWFVAFAGEEGQAPLRGADIEVPQPLTDEAEIRDLVPFLARQDGELSEPLATTVRTLAEEPTAIANTRMVRVTLFESGALGPAVDTPWWVIRTGVHDRGRQAGLGGEAPNPKPIHSGVTGPDGLVQFEAGEHELLHLFTERSDAYARGSWPLQIEDQGDTTVEVELSIGTTLHGRVVDDAGQPLQGVAIQMRTFFDEAVLAGQTDSSGLYSIEHVADFPRSYSKDKQAEVRALRSDYTGVWFSADGELGLGPYGRPMGTLRPFRVEDAEEIQVVDVVLERGTYVIGHVSYADGRPAGGSSVSVEYVRRCRATGERLRAEFVPLPWEPDGRLLPVECLADEHGQFRLRLKAQQRSRAKLTVFAPDGGCSQASLPALDPGQTSDPVNLVVPNQKPITLRLVDAADPLKTLWQCDPKKHVLLVWPEAPRGTQRAEGSKLELNVPADGRLELTQIMLEEERGFFVAMLTGYKSIRVAYDFSQGDLVVALEKVPVVSMTLKLIGEGAGGTKVSRAMISVLPPVPPKDPSRSFNPINPFDSAPHMKTLHGIADGDTVLLPRPDFEQVWIYVQPHPHGGYMGGETFTFGPFGRDVLETVCEVEVPAWQERVVQVPGKVLLSVVSSVTGEPVEGAHIANGDMGHRGFHARGEGGIFDIKVFKDEFQAVVSHTLFRPVTLERIVVEVGATVDLGEVRLDPLIPVRGQLLDSKGEPLNERRSIRIEGPAGTKRWSRSGRDGSFEFGVEESAPSTVEVGSPSGQASIYVDVPLVPVAEGSPGTATGEERFTCTVPDWRPIVVDVSGLGLDLSGTWTPIIAESLDGTRVKIWQRGVRNSAAFYEGVLPPGPYVLKSGPLVELPDQAFQVPSDPMAADVTLRSSGKPVYR